MRIDDVQYVKEGYKQVSIGSILKNLPDEGWFAATARKARGYMIG
jgi:hypothetical protein